MKLSVFTFFFMPMLKPVFSRVTHVRPCTSALPFYLLDVFCASFFFYENWDEVIFYFFFLPYVFKMNPLKQRTNNRNAEILI